MHSVFILVALAFSVAVSANTNEEKLQNLTTITRIAFGSCNDQDDKQPLWKDIQNQKPDLWIWGGDAIYADWTNVPMQEAYKKQSEQPDYAALKEATPIIGTWDDHDYGKDGANGNYRFKQESQKLFLDFMGVSAESPRRLQEGVYTSYEFGEEDQKIKIILLDNRYFKGLEKEAPLLGMAQWQWLEKELANSTAKLHFIVAGLSVFSPLLPYSEEWWQFPIEVQRMQNLLKTYKVKAPVFLTGDKHFASIFKFGGYLEFMSSGLTHTAPPRTWWYLGRKFPTTYFGLSYGLIDIEWKDSIPTLKLIIRNGVKNVHSITVKWTGKTWKFMNRSGGMVVDPDAPVDDE